MTKDSTFEEAMKASEEKLQEAMAPSRSAYQEAKAKAEVAYWAAIKEPEKVMDAAWRVAWRDHVLRVTAAKEEVTT